MIAARRAGTSLIICAAYEWKSLRRLLAGSAEVAKHKITLGLPSGSPKFSGRRALRRVQGPPRRRFTPDWRMMDSFTVGGHEPGGGAPLWSPVTTEPPMLWRPCFCSVVHTLQIPGNVMKFPLMFISAGQIMKKSPRGPPFIHKPASTQPLLEEGES